MKCHRYQLMCTERLTTRYISTNALCLKLHENKQVIAETRGFHFFPRFSIRLFCCLCKAHLPATVCIQSVLQPSPKLAPTILRNAVHSGRRRMTPTVSWSTLEPHPQYGHSTIQPASRAAPWLKLLLPDLASIYTKCRVQKPGAQCPITHSLHIKRHHRLKTWSLLACCKTCQPRL